MTEKKLLDRITQEPAYRLVLYKILKFCETSRSAAETEKEILAYPEMKTAILSPSVLLSWLQESGGLERVVERKDERWQTTEVGKKVVEMETPGKRILELISKESEYSETYVQVLGFCQTPKTRVEIEEWFKGNPVTQELKAYPAFFIQRLEDVGGIEWVDQHWRTTVSGKGVLDNIPKST
jgi:hypothetical protein